VHQHTRGSTPCTNTLAIAPLVIAALLVMVPATTMKLVAKTSLAAPRVPGPLSVLLHSLRTTPLASTVLSGQAIHDALK
jgi:hypothetical protein